MLGISFFAISCKKQETQNDNSMSDSASTGACRLTMQLPVHLWIQPQVYGTV